MTQSALKLDFEQVHLPSRTSDPARMLIGGTSLNTAETERQFVGRYFKIQTTMRPWCIEWSCREWYRTIVHTRLLITTDFLTFGPQSLASRLTSSITSSPILTCLCLIWTLSVSVSGIVAPIIPQYVTGLTSHFANPLHVNVHIS